MEFCFGFVVVFVIQSVVLVVVVVAVASVVVVQSLGCQMVELGLSSSLAVELVVQ